MIEGRKAVKIYNAWISYMLHVAVLGEGLGWMDGRGSYIMLNRYGIFILFLKMYFFTV